MTPTEFEIWWTQFSQYGNSLYFCTTTVIALIVSAVGVMMTEEDL